MYHIGILQLTQNLDDAVQGFKAGLKACGLEAEYHYLNADGNAAQLPKLANQLSNQKPNLIFACTTPAAKAAIEFKDIPVVYTPVFDPVGAGLAASMTAPGGNATGVAGMVNAADKIVFIEELLPNAKNIGILYHSKDDNALVEVANFRKANINLNFIELPIEQASDLSKLPDILPAELDALFLPIGRAIEENFATIVYYTDAMNLPIITSHAPNVPLGALGALVADHYKLGLQCAAKAEQILRGESAGNIAIDIVKEPDILLNNFAALNLGIELPQSLTTKAKEIFD